MGFTCSTKILLVSCAIYCSYSYFRNYPFFFYLSCVSPSSAAQPPSPRFHPRLISELGVLHGFSRKSNKGEFSRKTKWGDGKKAIFFCFPWGFAWIFSEIKRKRMGAEKKAIFLFSLGFCMDFLGNQTENEWRRKKSNFFCFP